VVREGLADPDLVDLVLRGHCDDAFKEFDYSIEGLTVFYRENEAALLHEQQRRRLPGKPWLVKAYRLDARPQLPTKEG
jgi:hypothetical protein